MPLSTLSTYLGAMLGRGDAKRIPNPSDGRSVRARADRPRARRRANGEPAVHPGAGRARGEPRAPVGEVRAVLREILEAIERADAELATERKPPGRYYELVVSCGATQAEEPCVALESSRRRRPDRRALVAACGAAPAVSPIGRGARRAVDPAARPSDDIEEAPSAAPSGAADAAAARIADLDYLVER